MIENSVGSPEIYQDEKKATICQLYYDLYYGCARIYPKIKSIIDLPEVKEVLFVGGLTNLAAEIAKTKKLTFVDFSEQIIAGAKKRLGGKISCYQSDIRSIPDFGKKFDLQTVLGRVSAYLYSNQDNLRALSSLRKNLKIGGYLLIDFFDADKMINGETFNNQYHYVNNDDTTIERFSKSVLVPQNDKRTMISWEAEYRSSHNGEQFSFTDNHLLRGYSKQEINFLLREAGFSSWIFFPSFEDDSIMVLAY